jgi:hypothetical protein
MHSDARRLSGKPAFEVLDEIGAEEARNARLPRERLYLEPRLAGRGADATRPFAPHEETNPPRPMSEALGTFLRSSKQQVMLVSGVAGSGKSTACQEARRYLRTQYRVFYAMRCDAMRCDAMRCDAMLCYAMLCYAMLCYAMLCYAMLCYAMLCYAMLCAGTSARSIVRSVPSVGSGSSSSMRAAPP